MNDRHFQHRFSELALLLDSSGILPDGTFVTFGKNSIAITLYADTLENTKDGAEQLRRFKKLFGPFYEYGKPPFVSLQSERTFHGIGDVIARIYGAFVCTITSSEEVTEVIPAVPEQVITTTKHTYDCKPRRVE